MSQPFHFLTASKAFLLIAAGILLAGVSSAAPQAPSAQAPATKEPVQDKAAEPVPSKPAPAVKPKPTAPPANGTKPAAVEEKPAPAPAEPPAPVEEVDDEAAAENAEAEVAAVAKPVSADPIQIYGWREDIMIGGVQEKLRAKLDTGALTSSIHAEEKELFERDGKKWVRFIVTDPGVKKPVRTRIEAPLVRIAKIKEPGAESVPREVVRLSFQIGERKLRGEFTLNNRANMLSPVLIGRNMIKDLGWVDPARIDLANEKIFR